LVRLFLIVFAEVFRYIRYSLLSFTIVFYVGFIILLFSMIFDGSIEPIFKIIGIMGIKIPDVIHINKKVILSAYAKFSLIFYVVNSLINRVLKIKFNFTLKQKIKYVGIINFVFVFPIFLIFSFRFNFFDNILVGFIATLSFLLLITVYIIFTLAFSYYIELITSFFTQIALKP
jgi:hypothetical protein